MVVKRYHIDVMPELGILAANVKRLRQSRGLTQKQLSVKANVSTAIISGIENGTGNPSILTVLFLAEALGVAPGEFLIDHNNTND